MARDVDGILSIKWANSGDTGEPLGFDRNEGWPLSYSQPGGDYPTRELFNLLFEELSALGIELNQNGVGLEYSALIDYVAKALVRGSDGDYYIAASANGPATAVKNPVGDLTGVWENFYLNTSLNVATETANAIIVNAISGVNPSALFNGQLFDFKATANNTGAMTVQVGSLAAKSLKHGDGSALTANEILQNKYYKAAYNKTSDRLELVNIGSDIPSGEKILFYKNTAVVGYSLLDTLDDKLVFVTKGSVAGGQTGGTVHSTGTWTQPNHLHTTGNHSLSIAELAAHTHPIHGFSSSSQASSYTTFLANPAGTPQTGATASTGSGTAHNHGNTGNGATAATYRPAAYCFTMQQRA